MQAGSRFRILQFISPNKQVEGLFCIRLGLSLPDVMQRLFRLRLSRSSLYYEPRPTSERDLRLMGKIDKLHTTRPFADPRMLRDMLRLD